MSPEYRQREDRENDESDIEPDPFGSMDVLKMFLEFADRQGFHEANQFLIRTDLVQLQAKPKGAREMTCRLSTALLDEHRDSFRLRERTSTGSDTVGDTEPPTPRV
jgi:hypothetical protein